MVHDRQGISIRAANTAFDPACSTRDSAPLLQSRGCKRIGQSAKPLDIIAKRFYVSGVVQGVGYRFFVEQVATRLGISGFARNLDDGRVEIYAVGSEEQLASLRTELHRGPRMSKVSEVTEQLAEVARKHPNGFAIG